MRIAFLIERTPFASSYGDACLDAAGGYSIGLKFWWHINFPFEVVFRTLKYLPDNKNRRLISINVLEFVVVIIDYCAALTVITTENVTEDPHPILLNIADNTSTHSWTMQAPSRCYNRVELPRMPGASSSHLGSAHLRARRVPSSRNSLPRGSSSK